MTVVDLFAGPGGWGAHEGIEDDADVVATRRAAGIPTRQADVSRVNPTAYGEVEGVIASPPCPPFSVAGTGRGRLDLELIARGLEDLGEGRDTRRKIKAECEDPRSTLSLEPLRWVLELEPEWTAWEQVVGAKPLWDVAAEILAERGYNVWTGFMDASDYGVAQTRKRLFLLASRTRFVECPEPHPERVVMRDVLGDWGPPGMTLRMGRSRGTARTLDQPAPTIMFGKSPSGVAWYDAEGKQIRGVSIEEALLLQGFPPDYPLRGGKVSQYRQVGNAVPRGLARAALRAVDPATALEPSPEPYSRLES